VDQSFPNTNSGGSVIPPPISTTWLECITAEGQLYYYNRADGTSTWDKPLDYETLGTPQQNSKAPVPETTVGLLQDPAKIEFFRKFLESEASNGEILFYMDVQNFRRNARKPLLKADFMRAEAIFLKYIKKGSPFEVKMTPTVTKALRKTFKEALKDPTNNKVTSDIFDDAEKSILHNLEQEQLPRFMKSMFYITMYNSVLLKTSFELPEELWNQFVVASEGGVEDGWTYVSNTKGILVHKKQYRDNDMFCTRGSTVIPLPLEEMYIFGKSIKLRENWDNYCTGGRVVEQLDERTAVIQYEFKPPKWAPMMKSHDFVTIRTEKILDDGTILLLSRSIIHPDAPERKGITRSEVDVTGFVLRSCGTNSCVVIYTTQAHLKGVPKWAEASAVNKRALLPNKIRKFVEKELKDKKKSTSMERRWAVLNN